MKSHNQSKRNRTFENNQVGNKKFKPGKFTSNTRREKPKTISSNDKKSKHLPNFLPFKKDMNCDFSHWGATAELMEIIRKRKKRLDTLRLVERKLEISRPRTMRKKRYQPSRPNKRSHEKISQINGELLNRANRFGGGSQPLEERVKEENQSQEETEENEQESESESQISREDKFSIVDLKAYNTEG